MLKSDSNLHILSTAYKYFRVHHILEFLLTKCEEMNSIVDAVLLNEKIQVKKALGDLLLLFISKSDKATEKFREDLKVKTIRNFKKLSLIFCKIQSII